MKIIGAAGTIAAIAATYVSLGFPTPATSNDIQKIEQRFEAIEGFMFDTRIIQLGQELRSAKNDLRDAQADLAADPSNSLLKNYTRQLERQVDQIDDQIKRLEESKPR